MSKLAEITPIKDGMSKKEAREATKTFLSEILKNHRQINPDDICSVEDMHSDRSCKVATMVDGSKWVEGAGGSEWEGRMARCMMKQSLAAESSV